MAEQICPACGCAVSGPGHESEGKTYCCEPCASTVSGSGYESEGKTYCCEPCASSSSCECGCCHSCEDHEEHK